MVLKLHPQFGLGHMERVNIWIRQGSYNLHLAVLIALQLKENWEAKLRIIQVVPDESHKPDAQSYLNKLKKVMRLPKDFEICVLCGKFDDAILGSPLVADINIFGMPQQYDIAWVRMIADKINTSVLFLKDSGQEDAVV